MRRAIAQALRDRDSRVVAATRGMTCKVLICASGRPGSVKPSSRLSSQAPDKRSLFSARASALASNSAE
jgi:hypothetical protein